MKPQALTEFLFDEPFTGAVHGELGLLGLGLDGDEAHGRALQGLADGGGIGRVVLAALTLHCWRWQ